MGSGGMVAWGVVGRCRREMSAVVSVESFVIETLSNACRPSAIRPSEIRDFGRAPRSNSIKRIALHAASQSAL